jgi:tetratricopeptide (TPR) repeat protein
LISYENFDLRLRADGEAFVVSARLGARHASEPFKIDLSDSCELAILESLGRDAVEQRGANLFDALICGRVRNLYHQARGHMSTDPTAGLRIRIYFDPRDERLRPLFRLPWEIVRDRMADGGNLLAFDPRRPIVRVIDSVEQTLDSAPGPVERVLLAVSNPIDSQPLEVDRDCAEVTAALAPVGVSPLVLRKTTRSSLLETIADFEPQVVHFISHGMFDETAGEGALLLEDELGLEDPLFASALASCFVGRPMPRLVILSACSTAYSGGGRACGPFAAMAVALVATGLPVVIAMQCEVLDRNAIHFTSRLYRCLVRGNPIEAAVAEARAAVGARLLGGLDWAAPVLFVRANVPEPLFRTPGSPEKPVFAQSNDWRRAIEQAVQEGRYAEAIRIARTLPTESMSVGERELLEQLLVEVFESLSAVPTNGFGDHLQQSRETAHALLLRADNEVATNVRKALSTYEEIYSRFQDLLDPAVQEQVSRALIAWVDLGWYGLQDAGIAAVADVIIARQARFLAAAEDVTRAWLVKAEIQLDASRFSDALRLFDELLATRTESDRVTRARICRARALAGLGRTVPAIVQLTEVISGFDSTGPHDAANVRDAYKLRALLLESSGSGEEALQSLGRACDRLVAMCGEATALVMDTRMARAGTAERLGYRNDAQSEYERVAKHAGGSALLAGYASRARRASQRLRSNDASELKGTRHGE